MNYSELVHIVTSGHLRQTSVKFPDAADEIEAWTAIVEEVRWKNFEELRSFFKDADSVNGYVIFNIRRNRYRLVTVIHYARPGTGGHVYIRSFLTHKQDDNPLNWDKRFGSR